MSVNRQWLLVRRPQGMMALDDFKYQEAPFTPPDLKPGEVLVKNQYFSLVPAQRTWMNADSSYFPPMQLNKPVVSPTLAEVVASANEKYPVGAMIATMTGWEDYTLLSGKFWGGIIPAGTDPVDALSLFGGNTLTAYFGLLKIGQPKEGETVVVSGAAGSTGSMAAQIARIKGCKVIGIAGGKAKCDWLLSACKLDGAIDYRSENVSARLRELAPKGVDVFYDNVGGTIMQDVIDQMAMYGRVVLCGQIAEYNSSGPAPGPRDMFRIISHRLKIQGFISADYMGERNAALADLTQWAQAGQLVHRADVRAGFQNLPATYFDLFNGGNAGTLILKS
jgi:NADPH-dependent curcumin reductase CurA